MVARCFLDAGSGENNQNRLHHNQTTLRWREQTEERQQASCCFGPEVTFRVNGSGVAGLEPNKNHSGAVCVARNNNIYNDK